MQRNAKKSQILFSYFDNLTVLNILLPITKQQQQVNIYFGVFRHF